MRFKPGDIIKYDFARSLLRPPQWAVAEIKDTSMSARREYYSGRSTNNGGETWWPWQEQELDEAWDVMPEDFDIWTDYVAWRLTNG